MKTSFEAKPRKLKMRKASQVKTKAQRIREKSREGIVHQVLLTRGEDDRVKAVIQEQGFCRGIDGYKRA